MEKDVKKYRNFRIYSMWLNHFEYRNIWLNTHSPIKIKEIASFYFYLNLTYKLYVYAKLFFPSISMVVKEKIDAIWYDESNYKVRTRKEKQVTDFQTAYIVKNNRLILSTKKIYARTDIFISDYEKQCFIILHFIKSCYSYNDNVWIVIIYKIYRKIRYFAHYHIILSHMFKFYNPNLYSIG